MIRPTHAPHARGGRPGLTLIEVLVVLGILSVLVALTVTVVIPLFTVSDERNTKVLLQKVDKALEQRWTEVLRKAQKEPLSAVQTAALDKVFGANTERNRVIWVKLRLKQHFPMSYAEALFPHGGNADLMPHLPSLYLPRLKA